MTQGNIPPGWYDDGQGTQRWWDGNGWTEHTQPAGGAAAAPSETSQPGQPETAPAGVHDEPTRVAGAPTATPAEGVGLDKPADPPPAAPAAPSSDVTMMSPGSGYPQPGAPAQQPPYGQQAPQQPYGQQSYGQQGGYPQQGAYAAPGQPQQPWQTPYGGAPTSSGGGKGKLIALIGGGVAVVVVIGVVLLLVLGGGGGAEGAAKDYLEAQADLDVVKACELTSEDSRKEQLESADAKDCDELGDKSSEFITDEVKDYFDDTDIDIEIDKVDENGDEADVDYTVKTKYEGDDPDGFKEAFSTDKLEETESGSLQMVKEDGDWKVADDG